MDESRQGLPSGGVHVDVILVIDVLIVDLSGLDSLGSVTALEQTHESVLELLGVGAQELVGVVGEDEELALVGLARRVALESVLVSALLLAHLAVPTELLQPLGLHLVGQVLDLSLIHI